LKITHVFVTHTHMDHFIGFDNLLRVLLGRDKALHLFGPPGFFKNVEGKLAGYTWNLVNEFTNNFLLEVNEVHPDRILTNTYACQDRFVPKGAPSSRPFSGTLLKEPSFSVYGVLLDHRVPCLGLSLTENFYVNIIKQGLTDMGLPVGPWLNRFKSAIYRKKDLKGDFFVTWEENGKTIHEKKFILGDLVNKIAKITPGQKIAYITDVVASPDNSTKIVRLAKGANVLFIEGAFLDSDKEMARKKHHLTAKEAGKLAAEAGVNQFRIFHFSPRYKGRAAELEQEAREAYDRASAQGYVI
ncbi:MAG: ribonuclease Z, partial [Deltaproteobacteria bacterium]|nr:ribonuclease Z [Deltaproteobacteria bacterium]